jgi:hypothetical protein
VRKVAHAHSLHARTMRLRGRWAYAHSCVCELYAYEKGGHMRIARVCELCSCEKSLRVRTVRLRERRAHANSPRVCNSAGRNCLLIRTGNAQNYIANYKDLGLTECRLLIIPEVRNDMCELRSCEKSLTSFVMPLAFPLPLYITARMCAKLQ